MRRQYLMRFMFLAAASGIAIIGLHFYLYIFKGSSKFRNGGGSGSSEIKDRDGERVEIVKSVPQRAKSVDNNKPRIPIKHKIVHLDLKGMPPTAQSYEKLFPFFRKIGATGILIEYEDMFPYHGRLQQISNKEAYSKGEITKILSLAKASQLQVIPLVQTFGHLEFVLKIDEFEQLREVPKYMQVICPTNNESQVLVREMIDQLMELHPAIKYLHIGSDEVYHIGMCPLCQDRMAKYKIDESQLFLQHVKGVAQYVKSRHKVQPIMWDDEFRKFDEILIQESGIGPMVEIIVWNYHTDVENRLYFDMWQKYSRLFKNVWVGSAFKGADKPNSRAVNESLYLGNHYSWVKTMKDVSNLIKFKGVFLTGWQRFDHFAVLCELLPSAIPSLTACLMYLNDPGYPPMETILQNASSTLECANQMNYCNFPGSDIHQQIIQLQYYLNAFKKIQAQNVYLGWGQQINLDLEFSNPSHVESILQDITSLKVELDRSQHELEKSLEEMFPKWSVQEWIITNIYPLSNEVRQIQEKLESILNKHVFPRRPLDYSAFLASSSPSPRSPVG